MKLHPSPFERTTALTDFILAVQSLLFAILIQRGDYKSTLWMWAFGLLALSSFLGALAHGFDISARTRKLLWQPLNLSLGLALGFFVAGALFDLLGESVARASIPYLLGMGFAFYMVTVFLPETFLPFIFYEATAMLFALGAYLYLTSFWMSAGILVTIVAATIQAVGKSGKNIFWNLDNNGMFHLVQMAGLVLLFIGLRLG